VPRLSRGLSRPARRAACARFTPSHSGQRSPPTYYRGCWHVVSRGFFPGYRPSSPPGKGVYTPKGVIPHAASLRQACAHCGKSLAAASRRSRGRLPVPVWLAILSDQRPVIASVGRYPADQLMGRGPLPGRPRKGSPPRPSRRGAYAGLADVSAGYPPARGRSPTCSSPVRRSGGRSPPRPTCMH
jgi:hypothetical protein